MLLPGWSSYAQNENGQAQQYEISLEKSRAYPLTVGEKIHLSSQRPTEDEVAVTRGAHYQRNGDLDNALTCYNKAIEINPRCVNAYVCRGLLYIIQKYLDNALDDLNKAVEIDPSFATAYLNRGLAYDVKDEPDKALADYGKCLELDPTNILAYSNRCGIYYRKKEFDKALTECNSALGLPACTRDTDIAPSCTDAYNNRALIHIVQQNFDEAWADVHKLEEMGHPLVPDFMEKLKKDSGRDH